MPIVFSAWRSTPSVVATPGYSVFIVPWAGYKSTTGFTNRTQDSAQLGGGYLINFPGVGPQNDEVEWDIWLEAGTYTLFAVSATTTDRGISTFTLDGSSVGTLDWYAGSTTSNVLKTITGITVATAGLKSFKVKMATKNASSSNYYMQQQSFAWIRTGA